MERKIREQRQQVFDYGFGCMMSTNCSDLITQKECKTCPVDICEQEQQKMSGHRRIVTGFKDYIHTKLYTEPQHGGFK